MNLIGVFSDEIFETILLPLGLEYQDLLPYFLTFLMLNILAK